MRIKVAAPARLQNERSYFAKYLPEGDSWEAMAERTLKAIKRIELYKKMTGEWDTGVYDTDLAIALGYRRYSDNVSHCYSHVLRVLVYERKIVGPAIGMFPYNSREYRLAAVERSERREASRLRREEILSG